MDRASGTLRVFFEEPFWIGVFEAVSDGKLSVCKVTFGPEPKEYEVNEFILRNYYQLRFSPAVAAAVKEGPKNPKKMQRDIRRSLKKDMIGTKSQQALKLQQEQLKTERKQIGKEQKEAEKQRMFELKQQKKKEKHRGR